MRGCLNFLTFLVILAVAVFIVLAIIGWMRDGAGNAGDGIDQAVRLKGGAVAVELLELY
ncbi:MAG: hypothetical protein GW855_05365 [Erythrobacter sp.]|nr:hypothetical protein [Erythrobacter sp.]NCQ63668.1 hypothetical protein [Alphaproteobacteria bacterium]